MGFTCTTINDFGTLWLYSFLCLTGLILTRWYFRAVKISLPEDFSEDIEKITELLNEQNDPRVMVFPTIEQTNWHLKAKRRYCGEPIHLALTA